MTESALRAGALTSENQIACPHCGELITLPRGAISVLPGAHFGSTPRGPLAMVPDICPCPVCGRQMAAYENQSDGAYWCDGCRDDRDACAGVAPTTPAPQHDTSEESPIATRTLAERAGDAFAAFVEAESPTDDELYGTDAHMLDEPPTRVRGDDAQ